MLMIPADTFTYATVQRSMLDLAKNYGFTHSDTSAIECLTSAVFHYMQQVSTDTKLSAELAGRSAACSSDVIVATKKNRLDIESLNQYMIWNEPVKTSTELPQYPVAVKERSESPISDTEMKEREEKEIPKFAPSIRFKPKVKKPPEEPVEEEEEEEEENIDELTLAAMRICSSIKPITHAAKNVDEFDKLSLTLSECLPNFDHYSSKYEHEIDFLGNSLAAQEAAAAVAAVNEKIRLEEEAHRQKILEQEKLQYQQSQYYQQPEEPMIDFEDERQQKMVDFSKEFIPEEPKQQIQKEEFSRIESPMMDTLAEDLYVSPSPSPPPEIKPSYSQEPPPLKPIPSPVVSESQPPVTVQPTLVNDLNQNNEIKNVEKEKHKKKHKHHKEKRREKDKKKDEERQNQEEKKIKKDKHKEKKKEKKKDKDREKDKEKHLEKTKEKSPPLLLPLQPPKLQPPAPLGLSKMATNASVHQSAPEPVNKPSQITSKKPEKEQKKKEKKVKDLRPLKEPEILPMQKLKPPSSLKFRMPQSQTSGTSAPAESSVFIPPNTVNLSGSSSSSKESAKEQSSYKSASDESRPHKKPKDKEREREKGREKERDKEKDKSLKRKHKDVPALIITPNIKESSTNDGEKERKMPRYDKEKKEKDRSNETPQEREERKRLKKQKKKREKEERKRKLEKSSNDSILGEPEQKKQKISEPVPPPPPENKPIKLKISLGNRPPAAATAPAPAPPPVLAPTISLLPLQSKVDTVPKPYVTQSVAKQNPPINPPKLPPSTFAPKIHSSSKPSSGKRTSTSSKSSSSRHHTSKKDRDETYRSSISDSALNAPKIMSERQQMSKALKESMETANLIPPSSSSSSRSDRYSSEQRIAKKKRPEKDKLQGEKKNRNGNLSLSTALQPPSLPSQLPPPLPVASNESPPKLELAAPIPENAQPSNDEEDDKYSWCPNCGFRYVDGDNMVYCERCHYWYHWSCVGILSEPQEDQWYCTRCIDALKKEKSSKK